MPDQPAGEIKLLRAAYAAFNARHIDAALATMTPEAAGRFLVDVHQVVRYLPGEVLAYEHVRHRFTLAHRSIQAMEVGPLPSSVPKI